MSTGTRTPQALCPPTPPCTYSVPTPPTPPQVISELVESCRAHDFTDIIMVHEHRGEPDGLVVCHLPYGPTAYFGIHNTVGGGCGSCGMGWGGVGGEG